MQRIRLHSSPARAGDRQPAPRRRRHPQDWERLSVAQILGHKNPNEARAFLERIGGDQVDDYTWDFFARPAQRWPEGDWRVWLILAGRGFGKTRTGSETVRRVASGALAGHIALVGETADDVRNVMVEGPDGILRRSPREERPLYESSKRRLTWPNGVFATTYAGCDPDQLRGPQHGFAWVDELAKFDRAAESWDNLMMGLRAGADPRCLVTTTPRPLRLLRDLVRRGDDDVHVTRGSTFDNQLALPPAFLRDIRARYEGTTLGRQELWAELLDESPGAIWKRALLDMHRVDRPGDLVRIGVGVDPSVSENGSGASCGIVVAGIDGGRPPKAFLLEDATLNGGPAEWVKAVVRAYETHRANFVVAESNQGGALIRQVLQAANALMPVELVHASRGKVARAEPVALLYERGLVKHVGAFPALEDEMATWVPGLPSPNRIDALVWILTRLLLHGAGELDAEIF